METTMIETQIQKHPNLISAKHYRPNGLGFVSSSPSYYPRKGEPITTEITDLFNQIGLEIKGYGLENYLISLPA